MNNTEYTDNFAKKRAQRRRRARKKRIITFLIALIIFLCVTAVTLCFTVFFPIEKIVVSGGSIYTNEEILEASYVKAGDNMFAFSSENLERQIRKKLPYISKLKIDRTLDGLLTLKVSDAKEKYCYSSDDGYFVADENAFVLNNYGEQPQNTLLISGMEMKLSVGEYAVFENEKKSEILNTLLEYEDKLPIKIIDIKDEYSIILNVDNRFEVSLGTSNNIKEKMAHLSSMIEEIGEERAGKINLSYWSKDKSEGTFVENKE